MANFAVIDTETNWGDAVMSIGTVVADSASFRAVDARYHVLDPEYRSGGMFSGALFPDERIRPILTARGEALADLNRWLREREVTAVFAYNALFDCRHLPELGDFQWYDIMRLAAYRQFNPKIPATADCCSTGRLRRGYGVEAMLRLLSGDFSYCETHNALFDAMDELAIMRLLGIGLEGYLPLNP